MSKINHNRLSLRYLDNFRRELARDDQRRSFWLDRNKATLAPKVVELTLLDRHLREFEYFDPSVQVILERLIAALANSEAALAGVIETLMDQSRKKRKSAKALSDAAHEKLVVAGAVFSHQNFDDMLSNQCAAWNWLRGFIPLLKNCERMTWHNFLSTVFDESLPLCIAEKIGSTPEEVDRFRLLLTETEAA